MKETTLELCLPLVFFGLLALVRSADGFERNSLSSSTLFMTGSHNRERKCQNSFSHTPTCRACRLSYRNGCVTNDDATYANEILLRLSGCLAYTSINDDTKVEKIMEVFKSNMELGPRKFIVQVVDKVSAIHHQLLLSSQMDSADEILANYKSERCGSLDMPLWAALIFNSSDPQDPNSGDRLTFLLCCFFC